MNIYPFYLLFLFSTCCAKVEEEQNNSQASHITKTIRSQQQLNTSLEALCPEAADIVPCVCYNEGGIIMDCSKVQDEEQLREVFTAFFPTTHFYRFWMENNKGVVMLEDGVFGDVSFQELKILDSVLEKVSIDAFTSSFSTLNFIDIKDCQIAEFPFEKLEKFTSLQYLHLVRCKLTSLPIFRSSTLEILFLNGNLISDLSPNAFTLLTAIEEINLQNNHLTEINPVTFSSLPELTYLLLGHNNISFLHSFSFSVSSWADYRLVSLSNNAIEFVEVDAFDGMKRPSEIDMNNNALTSLEERVWKPVLWYQSQIDFGGNPLSCGCDIAWLIRDFSLMENVLSGSCADGTGLTDLDPADFETCS